MYISKQYLNELSQKKILTEDKLFIRDHALIKRDNFDIFLSYSYHDKEFAIKLVQLLEQHGFSVYIDLNDTSLDRNTVNGITAKKLAAKMDKCRSLIYLYSKASSVSKWCPWELGYVSGKKNFRCAKIPLVQNKGDLTYDKQEYLEIYPTIDFVKSSGSNGFLFWINETDVKYIELKKWINGGNPVLHG